VALGIIFALARAKIIQENLKVSEISDTFKFLYIKGAKERLQ
jgi:hypothetical protein